MSAKQLSKPFVLTLSVAAFACGTEVVVFSPGGSGGATGSSTSSNGSTGSESVTSTGSGTTDVATTSAGPGGGDVPPPVDCPADPPSGYEACTIEAGEQCVYDVACQSGVVELRFTCSADGYGWTVVDQACAQPYDSCPGTELYCDGSWWQPTGTNPPSPCPSEPPQEFSACYTGGFGGVWENCGYYCDDQSTVWTVATCYGNANEEGVWEYDSACAP